MLILLLYAAGLRISEALSLRLIDVDLATGVLTIRESKFYKTRLVPMGPALTGAVGLYVAQRAKEHPTQLDGALFLAAPDRETAQGRRDHALLLFLYNSGARAEEAAQLLICELDLAGGSVRIRGKGGKERQCPLWPSTMDALKTLIAKRSTTATVLLNRCGHPITRFGIHALVERYVHKVRVQMPSLAAKRVSPHSIRHTTATHLLRAGVDINTVRAWLGHVSLDTTNIYAEIDLEMKARALAKCEITDADKPKRHWRDDPGLMTFLRTL